MLEKTLARPDIACEILPDTSILLGSREPLRAHPSNVAAAISLWASTAPGRIALADRHGAPKDWRSITYRELDDRTARLAQSFLDLGVSPARPVMLISDNRIESAVVQFAALRAGLPVAPVTAAYSAKGGDLSRLSAIVEVLDPSLVMVDKPDDHLQALGNVLKRETPIAGFTASGNAMAFEELLETVPGESLKAAEAAVTGDTVAKILFTSGSTGTPKGAINTHRMLTSNVQAIRQGWPFLERQPPVIVDWLPWNHTFGGNYVLNTIIGAGGSFYIDDGRPMPGAILRSAENSAAVGPTLHFNTPRGLDMMARLLAENDALAKGFFTRLHMVFFASAGLPARIRDDWKKLIARFATREVDFVSAWGTTETGPLATALNFEAAEINNIGVPIPGTTLKLAPFDGGYELCVKGPNVSPGYLGRRELTEAFFDKDGYFHTGDVGRLSDPGNPGAGILIEGRRAENFKLASGIWTNVSAIRNQLLEGFGPPVRDLVLSGPNRSSLSCLIFLDLEQCAARFQAHGAHVSVAGNHRVEAYIRNCLDRYNAVNSTNSRRIAAYRIMDRPLNPAAGELTEKGTVNQRAVLNNCVPLCDALDSVAQQERCDQA